MSHRTDDLAPLSGVLHFFREMRYHEASRQTLAFVLIALYGFVAEPTTVLVTIGTPLIILGVLIRLYASGFIVKNEQLATYGPYALVRHPLYTGNILIIIGFSSISGIWWTAAVAFIFFWFYYPTAIEYEDRKLRRLFGNDWEEWSSRTPALIPTVSNLRSVNEGNWSIRKSYLQNGEPIILVFIVFWIVYVFWHLP